MHAEPSSDLQLRAAAVAPARATARAPAPRAPERGAPRPPLEWRRFRYPQSLYKYAGVLLGLAVVAFSLDYLDIDLERLPGILGRMGETLGRRYFPPDVGHILNADYWGSVVETLQMSYLATVVGL